MTFLNTENTTMTSGVSAVFLKSPIYYDSHRNSGGVTNIAGPAILHSISVAVLSGTNISISGVTICVNAATSGMAANLSGTVLYSFKAGEQSGAVSDALVTPPGLPFYPDFLCRSGIVVVNSGTHAYDVIVVYSTKQA